MTGRTRAATGRRGGHSSLTDEDLISLVVEGDTRAFAALYDRHGRAAHSLAHKMMRERQAAEDLTQEAFLKAWRSAGGYRPERGSVRTWVLSIVQNRGIDQIRSAASRRRVQDRVEQEAPRSQPSDAFAEAWRNSQREQVREALDALPAEQLKILELAYFSGRTHAEISDLLGLPLGTVKGRMRLAREKLRGRFEPGGTAAVLAPEMGRGRFPPEAATTPSTWQGNAIHPTL
ncbi:MAG: RNA polymerase ECF-type sigma factor [uncultured Rubrobacteraceae bacterium]|uniref:RNA polymerase ECF-type sigma factor n=1 Tax=uncultured Rubrobacteraceae bacterium TaxID=349277 RepID=A0A6J4PR62_9ACTN|nr:MAG: RNA polymerase ECF-type sigma factor [uncultured Rubrobacteraceae bacterium]